MELDQILIKYPQLTKITEQVIKDLYYYIRIYYCVLYYKLQ